MSPTQWRAKCLRECDGADAAAARRRRARWLEASNRSTLAGCLRALRARRRGRRRLSPLARPPSVPAAPDDRHAVRTEFFDLLLTRGHWCDGAAASLAAEAREALDEALARARRARASDRAGRLARGAGAPGRARIRRSTTICRPISGSGTRAAARADRARSRHLAGRIRSATCRFPVHTRDAAPFLYYLFYRSPAPFDRLPIHDYVVTPIDDRHAGRRAAAPAARHQHAA